MTAPAPALVRVAAACGSAVRDRLAGPRRTARVLHRGSEAVYADADGWALGVVSARASRVPCALWLPASASTGPVDLARVETVEIGAGAVVLHGPDGASEVRVGRLVDVAVPRLRVVPGPALVDRLDAHTALARGELTGIGGVPDPDRLVGRGSGLTPLGDDVLCGWAATSYALGAPLAADDARERTTLLSATLLDRAARGEVLPEFRAVLAALVVGDAALVDNRAAALATVGHTSGSGLLLGVVLRLREAAR